MTCALYKPAYDLRELALGARAWGPAAPVPWYGARGGGWVAGGVLNTDPWRGRRILCFIMTCATRNRKAKPDSSSNVGESHRDES